MFDDAPHPAPRNLLPALLLLALLAAAGWFLYSRLAPRPLFDADAVPRAVTPRGDLAEFERTTIAVFEAASPSVVNIANVALVRDRWTLSIEEIPRGTGSGFVWDERGYVVTNAHVVEGGSAFHVTFADHSTATARLVAADPDTDLAVLKVDGAPGAAPRPLTIGTSADLRVGQAVFAIGNPFGLDLTLTTGVISGLSREIRAQTGRRISGVIQTDAAINPGNSGGPLLDSAGRLVGVNTAIMSPSGASAGIGFAIPVDTVNHVVPRLIRGEKAERPGLGIHVVPEAYLADLGIDGVGVLDVLPGSAAEKAGVRPTRRDPRSGRVLLGDVIVAIDGKPVKRQSDLFDLLDERQVGQQITLTVARGGETLDLPATLQAISRE